MNFVSENIASLNKRLGGSIQEVNGDRLLQFINKTGEGSVYGSEVDSGISYLEYQLELNESLCLDLANDSRPQLYFIYCSKGLLEYKVAKGRGKGTIGELQTAIVGGKPSDLKLSLKADSKANFAIIRISRIDDDSLLGSNQDAKLRQQVFDRFLESDDMFIDYIGTFNLKIREQLNQIRKIRQKGVVRTLLIKGIVHFTLGLEIQQYEKDKKNEHGVSTTLTNKELLRIEEAAKEIEATPEYSYSIAQLSRKYALSATKLQEGFKAIYGCTVAIFIKDKRVEAAERLLTETDMNISEVVYSIGFTSRSYFSKIFKKRYQCSPKYYKENCGKRKLVV